MNKVQKYKKLLLSLGCRQSEIATNLNISRQRVNDVINGRANFTEEQYLVLCRTYNINLNWLLADRGSMFIEETPVKNPSDDIIFSPNILNMLKNAGVEPDSEGILRIKK